MLNLVPTPKKEIISDEAFSEILPCIHTGVDGWQIYLKPYADMFERINECKMDITDGSIELLKNESLTKDSYRIESC